MRSIEMENEGIRVGLLAALAVALFYALFDVLAARGPLYTINLLGKAVFRGARDPAILQLPVPHDVGAMLLYTGLHLVLAIVIGVVVTSLLSRAERQPGQKAVIRAVIIGGFFVTVAAIGWFSAPFRPLLPWWSIVVANAIAVAVVGAYLLKRHPGLWQRFRP